jgi:hypothetical protein
MVLEAFQFVTLSPETSSIFPFNLILLDGYQKVNTLREWKKSLTGRKIPKKTKGGNTDIKKLYKTLFKLQLITLS